ncbi:hypothetical protein LY11_04589 [Pedobacter cryoconitis]|uniref:Core-binding (CB) domain-containing protein n=2 Tax=Pedobacter cryoconitis TaxID=188932 RepID=A0A327S2F4_9SPHI|nr:hypothetical protein LY11_04589 [Pedobacter cryoconitis]
MYVCKTIGDKTGDNFMRKAKILKIWNEYVFKLYRPTNVNENNKIEVHFNFFNQETGKNKQIKKSTGIDRYAKENVYTKQANDLIDSLIIMIQGGYNFITNSYPEYVKLNPNSNISDCIKSWLQHRETDVENGKIKKAELDTTGYVFDYYKAYLKKNNHLHEKPGSFTVNDITAFMRHIEKKRKLSPFTYNSYQSRLTYFYDFLIQERVIVYNPVHKAFRYSTKKLKTRYEEFDDTTLSKIQSLLSSDQKFADLYIASKLLFDFSIREVEQLRIQLGWIDFKTGILSLPEKTLENGVLVNATKNGLSAKFQLETEHLDLITGYIGERDADENYLFGGHGRPSLKRMSDSFLTLRWDAFRTKYELSKKLKMYALKHTGNYNSLDNMSPDQLSLIARHEDPAQINAYIGKRKRDVIKLGDKKRF